ncbi:MAG: MMPL family transporter, partial [Gammaproteobacteria bacterium]|nr:MMPL family transporter [Gammaproteobacteria bacterium]
IIASLLFLTLSLTFALQARFSHEPFTWLPEDNPARIATDFVNANMKGASSAEIIIDTGHENGLYDPAIMAGLAQLGQDVEKIATDQLYVGKSQSVADLLKEIHKALNENRDEFYTTPDDRELIAQEFLLFENSGSDDLEDLVDNQFQKARFTAKMPWVDSIYYGDFVADLHEMFSTVLGTGVVITVTGMAVLLGQTVVAAIYSMSEGYILAGGIITIMMVLLIGNIRLGLLSMIPNLAPIIVILGIMGLFDLPLDLFTMLIGSIAIGLAVDDTIHFMHNYRRYYGKYGDLERAIKETLHTSGRAMLVTTIVLSTGFFLYVFSSLNNLFNFGILTGLTIIMALLSLFFLAPALLHRAHKYNLIPDSKDY